MKIKEKLKHSSERGKSPDCVYGIIDSTLHHISIIESDNNKAMKVGAICGVIAALAVGGGLFAAGVALPILVLVGIAVAAAVLTGLVVGGITYVVSTKIENPDTSRSATEQGLPQPN